VAGVNMGRPRLDTAIAPESAEPDNEALRREVAELRTAVGLEQRERS
jgi:hypothetical protein